MVQKYLQGICLFYEKQLRVRNLQYGLRLSACFMSTETLYYGILDVQGQVAKAVCAWVPASASQGVPKFLNRSLLSVIGYSECQFVRKTMA